MPKQFVFVAVTFLHDLFTAIWIGGLITLAVNVMPAAKRALVKGPQMQELLRVVRKRMSVLVWISIVGLAITGILLSNRSQAAQGLFRFDTPYRVVLSVKHMLFILMVVVAAVRSFVLGRRSGPSNERLSRLFMLANLVFGILVLALSAVNAMLGSPTPPGV